MFGQAWGRSKKIGKISQNRLKRVFLPLGSETKKITLLKEDKGTDPMPGSESYPKCLGFQTYYKLGPSYATRRGILITLFR